MKFLEPKPSLTRLALFLSLLFALWTVRVVLLSPLLNPAEPNAWQDFGNIAIKWLLWVLPVFIVLAKQRPLEFLRLRSNIASGLLVGLVAGLLYALGIALFENKDLNLTALLTLPHVLVSAALPEELLFRGYVLRKVENALPFWLANPVTSLLFLAFHLPGWLYYGLGTVQGVIGVLLVGLVGGVLVQRTNSLWSAVLFHSFNNLAALALR